MPETTTEQPPEPAADTATAPPRSARAERSILRSVVFGTLGSVLLMIGSYGVGWLAGVSELRRSPW